MTLLYAMGITQHTCGGQNVKMFAVIQTLLGNMGRAGGGINALRGIHNVQGSTDMGLLYGNIPAYSGNPTLQYPADPNAFGKYMDALWGNPLSGRPTVATAGQTGRALMDGSYLDAYNKTATGLGATALQQGGFFNMTLKWFGGYTEALAQTDLTLRKPIVDMIYSLWPKGNGDNHIAMFRKMAAGSVKAAVVWGQNPAITEPNQGKVREGLRNLDTLVCVDMFETETAAIDRKPGSVTYLIPTAAHVEKAGSVTNSGRTLQWRQKAVDPAGNTKDDNELLLRFAEALDSAGAFSHISSVWSGLGITGNVFDKLYRTPYMGGAASFAAASVSAEVAHLGDHVNAGTTYTTETVTGSEAVAEMTYREMTAPTAVGGTLWIYTGAYNDTATWTTDQRHTGNPNWEVKNRAKSRNRADAQGVLAFGSWGYSWLVNRRVLYNNAEVPGDIADFFMGPDSCSRFFVSTSTAVLNYSRWYRTIHRLADRPDVVLAGDTSSPHYAGTSVSLAGRFPGHVEPYESPRPDVVAKWGYNTKGTAAGDLLMAGTPRGTNAQYPLVLTTIRCVEHFQGGPITRNNPYNHEAEPVPWVEINSTDARAAGIKDGDWVRIVTARNEGGDLANYGQGFKARVGSGLQTNQRTAAGVVAIPWHWGEKGLSTGSRANDLTIDAMDANTTIPEYKACLCRLEKI
jgi:formate dehydrogenase major subunit